MQSLTSSGTLGLGTIQSVPTGDTSKRVFAVETTSSDGDLIDLFAFHVAKENISIVDLDAAAPVAAAGRETLKQDAGFGLFDDLPASAPAPAPAPAQAVSTFPA